MQETLSARRWPVLELLLDEELAPEILGELTRLADAQDIDVQHVSPGRILELCHAEDHQGVLARLGEFPCRDCEQLSDEAERLLREASDRTDEGGLPLFVVCDRIQDAHNFGAILRCCDALNVSGVIIGERSQAAISPHVVRSSAGAVNHVVLYRVPELVTAVDLLSKLGYTVAAATEKTSQPVWTQNLQVPSVVVIGSEAFGVAADLLQRSTLNLTIPMLGRISSLNAAVAAGIILYEFRRQQTAE